MRGESAAMPAVAALALLAALSACAGPSRDPSLPAARDLEPVPIMGPSQLTPGQLADWFSRRSPRPAGSYTASVPLETLTRMYVEEGEAEGVAGDVAFVQSIVETGWFRFTGTIPASYNNFAGIGATGARAERARFPDARTGVRAQIQHLRAYADPSAATCTRPPLRHPCADPRFNLVLPKGKAPTWNLLGDGMWAAAPSYGASIIVLYLEARDFARTAEQQLRLVSRVRNPLTFSGRGIPPGLVAPSSNTPILGRRALPAGRRAPENLSPYFGLAALTVDPD